MILTDYTFRPDTDSLAEENCADVARKLKQAYNDVQDHIVINNLVVDVYDRKITVDQAVIHTYGITLINSRTLYGKIEVNYRQEWSRSVKGRDIPLENPTELYKHVSKALRDYLVKHTEDIMSKHNGVQKNFDGLPIELMFIQAPKSSLQGNGINSSNILFSEQLIQTITRHFNSYKKRVYQQFGGMDVFRFMSSDMYACADFLLGKEIDRESYPVAQPEQMTNASQSTTYKPAKRVIVRTKRVGGGPGVIKARDIKPSRKKLSAEGGK
ncbi:nuclease-related domain-containing protein [Oceanospirillum sediminis]|uniref:NERD domain-containing protein n=1 Tax=Oceanospirillum sediminis TaxID=2760088 RepID=A0A839IKK4_9GAMM|nr:nuclease-related domain-containing protein [Oceanospirillum sediminis]MBB1485240.1 NERD domain-containing protein [Oceanospirillum sediminis]